MLLKKRITEALALTRQDLDRLAHEPGPREPQSSTWEDWTLRDVWGHLGAWVDFATGKVEAMADGRPFDEVTDVVEFNRRAYDHNARLSETVARRALDERLTALGKAASRFSEADLDMTSWPTGFRMSLGRYLVMDAFVHHLQHILYHALKTGRDKTFLTTLEEAKTMLAWYDPAMDILGSFGAFFQGEGAQAHFFGSVDVGPYPQPIQARIRQLGHE